MNFWSQNHEINPIKKKKNINYFSKHLWNKVCILFFLCTSPAHLILKLRKSISQYKEKVKRKRKKKIESDEHGKERCLPRQVTVPGLPSILEVELIWASILLAVEFFSNVRARWRIIHWICLIHHPTPFIYITFSHFQHLVSACFPMDIHCSVPQIHPWKYHRNSHQNGGALNPKPPHLCLFPEKDTEKLITNKSGRKDTDPTHKYVFNTLPPFWVSFQFLDTLQNCFLLYI